MAIVYALVARGKIVLAEYTASSGNFPTVTRVLLAKIPLEDSRMSYVYDMHVFHYILKDGLTYLCMADNDFNRRIPFKFLEDMKNRFLTTYGDRGQTAIAFAMNADFQHVIQRQMDYFNANPEVDTVIQVQKSLDEVKDTMVENIEKVLGRGEKFELLVDRTDQLNQQSFVFNRKSRKLRKAMWWRSMKMWLCLGCLAVLIIYFVISMACGFDFSSCKASPPKSKIQEV